MSPMKDLCLLCDSGLSRAFLSFSEGFLRVLLMPFLKNVVFSCFISHCHLWLWHICSECLSGKRASGFLQEEFLKSFPLLHFFRLIITLLFFQVLLSENSAFVHIKMITILQHGYHIMDRI